jgi:hypothetical protein
MFNQINICSAKSMSMLKAEHCLSNEVSYNAKVYKWRHPVVMRMEDMTSSVAGFLTSSDNTIFGFNMQVNPKFDVNIVIDSIQKVYERLKEEGAVFRGFLSGGLKVIPNDKISSYSYGAYNKIADFFDKMQIPFGMVCGKQNSTQKDNLRINSSKIFIWGDYIKENLSPAEKNLSEIYEDVFIPENIKLQFFQNEKG